MSTIDRILATIDDGLAVTNHSNEREGHDMTTNDTTIPVLTPGGIHWNGQESSVLRVIGTGYLPESGARFGIGSVPVGDSARKVQDGPLVPGPWAYAYGLCVVLDNHGGTAAESARMQASGQEIVLNLGDTVEIDSEHYTVELYGHDTRWADRHNIVLVPVK